MNAKMKKFFLDNRVKVQLLYQGPSFTVIRAWVQLPSATPEELALNLTTGILCDSIGIAQRTVMDEEDQFQGWDIAMTRAIKSLYKKVHPETNMNTHVYRKL